MKEQIYKKCEICSGDGYTPEHAEGFGTHEEDGSCNGSCPVQLQCANCKATGYVEITIEEVKIN